MPRAGCCWGRSSIAKATHPTRRRLSVMPLKHLHFPNETASYRQARNALLGEEMELRRQIERVAAHRRALPEGGEVREDSVFEGAGESGKPTRMKLSQLFAPAKDTPPVYSFMFGPQR